MLVDRIYSDLIFSMVDESLDRLFGFRYRDRCLLSDSCLVGLNLFECGKCRVAAVSVDEHDSFLRK